MEKIYDAIQVNGVTAKDFVLKSVDKLAKVDPKTGEAYKSIHVVYSGMNEAFLKFFGVNAREYVDAMIQDKILGSKPFKGGILIWKYDPEWVKARNKANAEKNAVKRADVALNKILG